MRFIAVPAIMDLANRFLVFTWPLDWDNSCKSLYELYYFPLDQVVLTVVVCIFSSIETYLTLLLTLHLSSVILSFWDCSNPFNFSFRSLWIASIFDSSSAYDLMLTLQDLCLAMLLMWLTFSWDRHTHFALVQSCYKGKNTQQFGCAQNWFAIATIVIGNSPILGHVRLHVISNSHNLICNPRF